MNDTMETIAWRGWAFLVAPRSDAKRDDYRYEEDLHFGAVQAVERAFRKVKQPNMTDMAEIVQVISKHYDLEPILVSLHWARHYGPDYFWPGLSHDSR